MRIAFYAPLKPPTHGTPSGDRRVAGLLMDALARAGQRVELVSTFRSFDGDGDADRQRALRSQGEALGRTLAAQWRDAPRGERPGLWFTYHLYYKAPDWLGPVVSGALGIPYVIAEASRHTPSHLFCPTSTCQRFSPVFASSATMPPWPPINKRLPAVAITPVDLPEPML